MRNITRHIVVGDSANHQLEIEACDEPGSGGANHLYNIRGFDSGTNPSDPWVARHGTSAKYSTILFQNGPISEVGVNGLTNEALLAVLIDRMEGFQSGKFASVDNFGALDHMKIALGYLQHRTRERLARGVEGTHTV